MEQADAEGLKCYLESSHRKNLPFYKRRGFEQYEKLRTIYLTRDKSSESIELDIMVRNPVTTKEPEPPTAHSGDLEKHDTANGVHPDSVVSPTT